MSKNHNSRFLKRKAKLAQRAAAQGIEFGKVKPYSGTKYQEDEWAELVCVTELAVYETIQLTDRRLTNGTVKTAFTNLALRLGKGLAPALTPEDAQPVLEIGRESEFLIWNIRKHWTRYFEEEGKVDVNDLVGVLRTLLYSIKAHQWNTGRDVGYVAFLEEFLEDRGPAPRVIEMQVLDDEEKSDDLTEDDDDIFDSDKARRETPPQGGVGSIWRRL